MGGRMYLTIDFALSIHPIFIVVIDWVEFGGTL